jgi:acetyl esterase/lipase
VSTSLPGEVKRQIVALGAAITPEMIQDSWALLTPYHEKLGYQAPRVYRDRSYGDSERNRLDVHAPDNSDSSGGQAGGGRPVVLFVHGGGFVGGDKHVPGAPMYDHVGAWAVRHGAVGVTMTYRLAPDHVWPAGARDVAAAVAWTRENIASYGGDPARIVIVGHSAGAVHVASYLAGQGGGTLAGIRGAALLSGLYDLDMRHRSQLEHVYFGDHPAEEVSTLPDLVASPVPLLFSIAEHDPHPFHAQAVGVASAWYAAHRRMPAMAWVEGHNHISEIASLGIDEDALGVALARFAAAVTEETLCRA